jgi:hypothetical protein
MPGQTYGLWFDLPEGFTVWDLEQAPPERAAMLRSALDAADGIPPGQLDAFARLEEYSLARMAREGLAHQSSVCAVSDEGRLTTATLSVFVQDFERRDPRTFAADTIASLPPAGPTREISVVPLPCGDAIGTVEVLVSTMPGEAYGTGEDLSEPFVQAQMIVAFPYEHRIAIFVMSTPDLTCWADHVEIFGGICRTISFVPPAQRHIGDALAGDPTEGGPEDGRSGAGSIASVLG